MTTVTRTIKIICHWCGKLLKEIEGVGEDKEGICPHCLHKNYPIIYQLVYGDIAPDDLEEV